jgi:hypothetical protein
MFDFFAERKPKHNVEFDSEFYKEFNLIPLEKTPNLWDEFYKKININTFEMEHPDEPFVREFNKVFYETFRESFKDEGGEQ